MMEKNFIFWNNNVQDRNFHDLNKDFDQEVPMCEQ